jgi:hypothetical protein
LFTRRSFLFVFIATSSYAQDIAHKPSQRAQSVYGEIGGNGILLSANYDVRFANSQKGLGLRIGIGDWPAI